MAISVSVAPAPISAAVSGFDSKNLIVEQIIVHRVFDRAEDKTVKAPKTSSHLIKLPIEGREAIQSRITNAIGSKSHGVEMSIERIDASSFFQLGADLINATESEFIEGSQKLAVLLTQAQGTTTAPAGMLAVVRGRVGATAKRYCALIKADIHDGFGAQVKPDDVAVQYLEMLLLTPAQRLYKLGLLLEVNSGPRAPLGDYDAVNYRAFLFDHLITATETRAAAAYFYSTFLGMGIQKSSKKLTQDFFEHTKNFIDSSSIDAETKFELKEALRVELRSAAGVISASEFAKTHFPKEMQKQYRDHLDNVGFPKSAVVKDVEYVKTRLRRPRKLIFTSGVKVYVPPQAGEATLKVVETSPEGTTLRIEGSYVEAD